MKTSFSVVLCLAALALQAHAASPIDGKWEARFPDPLGRQVAVVFELYVTGNNVAGTVSNWSGSEQLHKVFVQDGKIQGNTVTFGTIFSVPELFSTFGLREWARIAWNRGAALNTMTGTVSNDAIRFIQRDWKGATLQFQATRVK
jgi:hypothetical protein